MTCAKPACQLPCSYEFFSTTFFKNLKLKEEDLPNQGKSTRKQLPNLNCLNQGWANSGPPWLLCGPRKPQEKKLNSFFAFSRDDL